MSGLFAVMQREMRTRVLIPLSGLLTGATIMMVGVALSGTDRLSEIGESSLLIAYLFLGTVAAGLGVTLVGRDLAGSRSVFFLSRPVGVFSIYFGKVLAALLLAFGSAVMFIVPALALGRIDGLDSSAVMISLLLAMPLIPICAALEVLAKARTVDLLWWVALSAGIVWLAWLASEPFRLGYTNSIVYAYLLSAVGVVALGTAVSHALAFAAERFDARRQARRFSTLYTSMVLIVALAIAGSAFALVRLPISSLDRFRVCDLSRDGTAVVVAGSFEETGLRGFFAIDLDTGALRRLPPVAPGSVLLTDHRVLWTEMPAEGSGVKVAEFPGDTRQSGLVVGAGRMGAVSDDGTRVAWVAGTTTQVSALDGKTVMTISSADYAEQGQPVVIRPLFESSSVLRMHEWNGSHWRIRRANLSEQTIETIGSHPGPINLIFLGTDRTIVRARETHDDGEFHEIDGATGILRLRMRTAGSFPVPLVDGRWAFTDPSDNIATIDRQGTLTTRRPPVAGSLRTVSEIRPGVLLIESGESDASNRRPRDKTLHAIDLSTGRLLASWPSSRAVVRFFPHYAPPGSPASRLVETEDGLFVIDPQKLILLPAVP
ncbi:MAG TPA: hypothetical protein VMS12_07955 [Thermoanaerobaculia bacterium]|nr:hypothetical protein [Thermoanaerobaculia bacterium]